MATGPISRLELQGQALASCELEASYPRPRQLWFESLGQHEGKISPALPAWGRQPFETVQQCAVGWAAALWLWRHSGLVAPADSIPQAEMLGGRLHAT